MSEHQASGVEFEPLVRESRQALVHYLGRLVGDADAEDVTQIALAKASAAMAGFRGEASPRGWLFRIATNAAHDWNRSRQGTRSDPLPADHEDAPDVLVDDAGQERRLVREEMSRCVAGVLRKLPDNYQTVLALSDCEELADRDVAAALDLTVGAAKIRLHRARGRLKEELERECSFYRDTDNTLCCDKKQSSDGHAADEQKSAQDAYRFDGELRHQVEGRMDGSSENLKQEQPMTVETLPTKQKHLIGVGAAVAAGCQPCTSSFVAGAHAEGACERGVRLALESGLQARKDAADSMAAFVDKAFAKPHVDAAFKAERKQLEALIGVAAALASNSASVLEARVRDARELGATDEQIRLAGQIGATARRGAEKEADSALGRALGDNVVSKPCCASDSAPVAPAGSPCGCSSGG
jgi:RNA polymerase sigma-70 factor (ECF subfamily)